MCRVEEDKPDYKTSYSIPKMGGWCKKETELKSLHPRDKMYNFLTL